MVGATRRESKRDVLVRGLQEEREGGIGHGFGWGYRKTEGQV